MTIPRPPGTLRTVLRMAADPLRVLPELRDRYGDLYEVSLPGLPTVVVGHPELAHAVLVRDFKLYRKDYMTRQLADTLGDGLLLSEGDTWRRHRRLAQPGFHASAIRGYAATMVGLAEESVAGWGERRSLDLHEEMARLTLRIVARTLFGQDIGSDAEVIGAALDVFMRTYLGVLDTGIRWPSWLPTRGNRRHRRALRDVDAVLYRMITDARRRRDQESLLGMLIAATDEAGGLTDRQLRDEAVTLLMAGHETTAVALTLALYLVSQHPNVEERLHAELDAVLGERAPTLEDAPALKYTRAVVTEAMRLYPPAWAVGRETLVDAPLGGHVVPKGTHLMIPQYVFHRDPRFWDRPEEFLPERWLDGDLEKRLPDGAYVPFGAGPRACIGKRFAELEALLVLATVARRASLRLEPGETLRLTPSITLRPEGGLRMHASRRRPAGLRAA